jgi:hypothetical protein
LRLGVVLGVEPFRVNRFWRGHGQRTGGRLILVDHVRSSVAPIYWIQRLMELAPSRGERELTRRPITHVRAAGFLVEENDRSRAGIIERLVAQKP